MKLIPITKGYSAMVDDEDFERISSYPWYARFCGKNVYASRTIYKKSITEKILHMHRVVLNVECNLDHIDGNGLNNQKSNLRICTQSQNAANSRKRNNVSSIYKGVSWDRSRFKWEAKTMLHGKTLHIGRYDNEKEAALAYNVTASFAHSEFARLNKI